MTETLILLDNTVLSNFSLVHQAAVVVQACPGRACTTAAALAEYQDAVEKGLLDEHAWSDLPLVELTDHEHQLVATLPARLGPGERTCLAVDAGDLSISRANALLAEMIGSGYRSPVANLDVLLKADR